MAKLTVRAIDALRPRAKGYKVTVDTGLYLRVAPNGTKTWLVRFVPMDKQVQVRLPKEYGNGGDGYMTLAEAISENARIQSLAREGVDYRIQQAEVQQQRADAREAMHQASKTVNELFEAWLNDGVSRKDGNAEIRRSFEKDALPDLGKLRVRDVAESHLLPVLRAVGRERGTARSAEKLLSDMRQMFEWAILRQPWRSLLVENGNPAVLVELKQIVPKGYEPTVRERILSPSEICELASVLATMDNDFSEAANKRVAPKPLNKITQLAIWICLSTGCRIGELVKAEWKNVDLENSTWFVPRSTTKTNVDWQVYLSNFSRRQFQALHNLTGKQAWCFPAKTKLGPLDSKTITKQIGDRQIQFKDRNPLKRRRQDNSLILAEGKNGEWTPHDLRRTAATMMQSLGISPDVIDRCQNHVLLGSKVRRHYLHHDYAEEKTRAWKILGDRLDEILLNTERKSE